ncbi:MAG: J domain-containing protein, partial [Anaerolineae bacterium]|nr:J domain-containing protein [Anaerolineae bacterium]
MPTTTDDLQQCYETLMLQPGASQEEIKEAYRDLVTVWHPDRFAGNPRLQRKAQAMLKRINDAFERLQAAAIAPAPERRR